MYNTKYCFDKRRTDALVKIVSFIYLHFKHSQNVRKQTFAIILRTVWCLLQYKIVPIYISVQFYILEIKRMNRCEVMSVIFHPKINRKYSLTVSNIKMRHILNTIIYLDCGIFKYTVLTPVPFKNVSMIIYYT